MPYSMYLQEQRSAQAIIEKIKEETGIVISNCWIHSSIETLGFSRSKSAARLLAIQVGRVDYGHLKKPIKSKELLVTTEK